jgi:hypothetical protein
MNRKPWQRLALSLIGVLVVAEMWSKAVAHLYTLPAESLASFTTVTINTQYVVGAIVVFMVTGKIFMDWKMNTISQVEERGEQIVADIKKTIASKHFDDGTLP